MRYLDEVGNEAVVVRLKTPAQSGQQRCQCKYFEAAQERAERFRAEIDEHGSRRAGKNLEA
eukprot:8688276-Pyramimonas_sp.AAC.1